MKIVLIGAGNVATHIATALAKRDMAPVQVWSRTEESANTLAAKIGSQPVIDIVNIVDDADIYIFSVVDKALDAVVAEVCRHIKRGICVHTAGTMSMDVFAGRCTNYGVLYPMQTFSRQKEVDFSVIPCFVEASDRETLDQISCLAHLLSERVYELSGDDRRWLHVAAVFACNFSNACYAMADHILKKHGLDFSVMLPLVDETTGKLHRLEPVEAQTGPAARKDYNVMDKHVAMLDNEPRLKEVYRLMSDMIIEQQNK